MSYFAVDDRFYTHRKTMRLRREACYLQAVGLWTLAGSWCVSQTDERETGVVPVDVLASLATGDWRCAMDALVSVGLWEFVIDGEGADEAIRFHDWALWNTPGGLEQRRTADRERKRRWRVKRAEEKAAEPEAAAQGTRSEPVERDRHVTGHVTPGDSHGTVRPSRAGEGAGVEVVGSVSVVGGEGCSAEIGAANDGPVLIDVPQQPAPPPKPVRAKPKTHIRPDWEPAPQLVEQIRDRHRLPDARLILGEVEDFRLHYIAKGEPQADWDARFRTWINKTLTWAGERALRNGQRGPQHPDRPTDWDEALRRATEADQSLWDGGSP